MPRLFGTDGIRGVANVDLKPSTAFALGRATAHRLVEPGGTIVVGQDTRRSGDMFVAAIAAGATSMGVTVHSAGVVPTPALAFLAADGEFAAGIMVSASHNPAEDNGLKVLDADGLKLDDAVEDELEQLIWRADELTGAPPDRLGIVVDARDLIERYLVHREGLARRVDASGLRIVLDCANGAMFEAAPQVIRGLGADVIAIHAEPNGQNINDQCGATHPADLRRAVIENEADLGLAFDGDGDRVIAVDHAGEIVDGDRMIALAALQLRDEGQLTNNTVVVTVMSNLGFHKAMGAAGIDVVTTPVGDRSVLEALDAGDYAVGGEQSGHIIYRHLATTGDGLLAGLRLARYARTTGRQLADLAGNVMTSYPQVLVNVEVADRHPAVAEELADEIAAAEATLNSEGRVLVRPSGTEPLIRVMVEAPTQSMAQTTADGLADIVRARFG